MRALALLLLSASAGATSFVERPFPETLQDAPVIVRGKVNSQFVDHARGEDGGNRIYTFYELQVSETLKGDAAGPSLIMRELGGEIGGVGMQVSGAAHFTRGDDVVVMLSNRTPDGAYEIWGMMMGRYDVRKSGAGEEYLDGPGIPSGGAGDRHDHDGPNQGGNDTPAGSLWTLARVRKTIATQGGTPAVPKNPIKIPAASPSGGPAAPGATTSAPAPALQNPTAEEPTPEPKNGTGLTWLWAPLAGALLAVFWLMRKRG